MSDGSVTIEVTLTKEQIEKGLKSINSDLKKIEKSSSSAFKNMSDSVKNFGDKVSKAGTALTVGLTTPLTALGIAGVKYNAQLEDFEANLTTLLGNADDAKDMLADLKEMANTTPFETSDLLEATQMMLGFGLEAKKTKGYLQTLGDISMGNAEKLKSLTRAFSQIGAAGKATMEDINQMIDAGFNPLQIMAEKTGKSMAELREEVSDGEVSFEDIAEAMEDATSEGGRYYKSMEKASKTMNGKMSTALDALNTALGDLTESLLPLATKAIDKITEWANAFTELDDETKQTILTIAGIVTAVGPALTIIGKLSSAFSNLCTPVGLATTAIGLLATGLGFLIEQHNKNCISILETTKQLEKAKEAQEEFNQTVQNSFDTQMSEIENVEKLSNELDTLVDKNGKVKEGYEGRVEFILNELNSALGTEYKLNGNIIDSYSEISDSIDNLIQKKRAEIILSTEEEKYNEAINKRTEAYENLTTTQDELTQAMEKLEEVKKNSKGTDTDLLSIEIWEGQVEKAKENVNSANEIYQGYLNDIATYEKDYETLMTGSNEQIEELINKRTYTYQSASGDMAETVTNNIQQIQTEIDYFDQAYKKDLENQDNYNAEKNLKQKEASEKQLATLAQQLFDMTSTTEELTPAQIEAWKALANSSFETYKEYINKMKPETAQAIEDATGIIANDKKLISETHKLTINMAKEYKNGISDINKSSSAILRDTATTIDNDTLVIGATGQTGTDASKEFEENAKAEETGKSWLESLWEGLTNVSWQNSILGVVSNLASSISSKLSFKTPSITTGVQLPGHKSGLDFVPYDNYIARLHKGERVLTAKENKQLMAIHNLSKSKKINLDNIYSKMQSAVDFETQRLSANLTTQATLKADKNNVRTVINDNGTVINNTQNFYEKNPTPYEEQKQAKQQLRRLAYGL